jgi:tetratricopeptide (TPR) repeat protein
MDSMELAAIVGRADERPSDVDSQIDAAYACDREDMEAEAVAYYDRAWQLGIPEARRHVFLIGYGSTLRNVGRLDDSLGILETAATEYPDDLAPNAFIALTLNSAGRSDEAVALLLESLIAADGSGVARFGPALASYAELLRQ